MTGKYFKIYHLTAKITSDEGKWLDFYSRRFDWASSLEIDFYDGWKAIDQTRLIDYTYGCYGADQSEYGFGGTNYRHQYGAHPILNDCKT